MLGFPGVPSPQVGLHPISVAAADLNGDGKPDFAVANFDSATVSVLIGGDKSTFAMKVDYPCLSRS
jgi:hypothetical protein